MGTFHSKRQLAVSEISSEVVAVMKSSKPFPPLITSVVPSRCIEERKWTGSTCPQGKGVGQGGWSKGCGSGPTEGSESPRMVPALVPIRRHSLQRSSAVMRRLALLCCLIMVS